MSGSCFGSDDAKNNIEKPVNDSLIECISQSCPKRFLIIYGDPGLDNYNLGRLPELAAKTHAKEVEGNSFPGVPSFNPALDKIDVVHSTDARAFVNEINNSALIIGYLAYFGHSWADDETKKGLLLIGEENMPETNLGARDPVSSNDIPVTEIKKKSFYKNAQIRLFGCRGGFGKYSVAKQIADHLGLITLGYSNSGGSLFTNDNQLGHGKRKITQSDITGKPSGNKDLWLIPANGTPTFREF